MNGVITAFQYDNQLSPQERSDLESLLGPKSVERISRFLKTADQERSMIGEAITKYLLSQYTDIPFEKIIFSRDEYGKPFWRENNSLFFNISHSDRWIICGISDSPIGVDIEKLRDIKTGLIRFLMTEAEQEFLSQLSDEEKIIHFFRVWSAKESYLKAVGKGLSLSPTSVELNLINIPGTWSGDLQYGLPTLQEYSLDPLFSCSAVVLNGPPPGNISPITLEEILSTD